MLAVEGVTVRYGAVVAVREVSLHVAPGELVSVLGPNGAGKTTLIGAIVGVISPTAGHVRFGDELLDREPAHRRAARRIGWVPEGRRVFSHLSVEKNLRVGSYLLRDRGAVEAALEEVYELFPILGARRRQLAGTLSGGEQQMLAIGRSLMGRPQLLLMDEPSLGLAPLALQEVFEIVRRLRDRGLSILLAEQNVRKALGVSDRVYVLHAGRLVAEGLPASVLDDVMARRLYFRGGS